ncbi:MAG: PQQ-binding-like beta-propeller repeat protein [bacterium]
MKKSLRFLMLMVVNVIAILGINGCGSLHFGPPTNNISKKWSYLTGGAIDSSPAIGADGTVYTLSRDNSLYAISPNGKLKWQYNGGLDWSYSIYCQPPSPAIGPDGTIYVSVLCGVTTISISSGNKQYYGTDKLYAINPDGTLKWELPVGGVPAIAVDGTVYVYSSGFITLKSDGTIYTSTSGLYAINPDGGLKWSYTTGNSIFSSPAIGADGTIYVGSDDGKLYAINSNGGLKWSCTIQSSLSPAYSVSAIGADGTIYAAASFFTSFFGPIHGIIRAINPNCGLKWTYPTEGGIYSSPAIGPDGTIYVSADALYAINPDGTLKWVAGICRALFGCGYDDSSPAIGADGTIYVGSWDGALYAINPDGIRKGSYVTGGNIYSSPAIGPDGTIYIGSSDGNLYALTLNSKNSNIGLANSSWPMYRAGPMHSGRVGGP